MTLFTKIIVGEIPCHKVAEGDKFLAFLDINPLAPGHTLVIPKKEIDYIFDLDDELYTGLHNFCRKVAIGLKKTMPCLRIGTAVVGLEVPHVHVHLIPLNSMDDINFMKPKLRFSDEEFAEIADKIRKEIEAHSA